MAIYTIGSTTVLYWITCATCVRGKDYPHALMWFSYGLANLGLLWYEYRKNLKS